MTKQETPLPTGRAPSLTAPTGMADATRPAQRHPLAPAKARFAYWWNNTPAPGWRTIRSRADSLPGNVPVIVSPAGQDGVTIGYAGLPVGRTNILQLLEHQRTQLGWATARRTEATVRWSDLAAGDWPDTDLFVVGAEERTLRRLPEHGSVTAPFRLHLVVDVPPSQEELARLISKRERGQFRRDQREHQWVLEEDSSAEALTFFYHRMHSPTMRNRHGERSRTETLDVARHAVLRHGTLFFLSHAGTRVAGVLCHWSKDRRTLTTRLLGVLDGLDEHYDTGAFKALYHHLLRWACEQRVARVDLFGTEAFIGKGIFQWKRKLGARPEWPSNHFATKRVRIYPRRDTPAVRDFLVANPLVRTDAAGRLTPVYYTDDDRPPRLGLSARCPGLAEPEIVHLDTLLDSLRRHEPSPGAQP
ncbi:GNAT family N-acetyltransferase [Streptomyces pakalii]|uniref:GNAT family N-acetyltransferase n=1 Tax=Streptomyces pakalii TaxID=3036494 RepID=A0ABT7D205_9ACTN|nr:GNAT family N-acetyltransferase [Streptomyces pakalii]MDJ1639543.1 GNAT family N-acetyltransferase [Streptomyces pakalii]